ncbi:MAG: sigma-70 family RNA polymerase sigma factor [Clostridia bacterium]|nr:sigma-70 family RNA polymerase sigma factor [Clostridia bacterium]
MKKQKANEKAFQKLLREIRKNPDVGLEKFYNTYGKIIQLTARSMCRSFDQADAVINAVLVKIWRLSQEPIQVENPEGWVYTVTANTAKDALREKAFLPLQETVAAECDGVQAWIEEDVFYSLIAPLSEEERALMIEKFIQKYTFREIAERYGKNVNAVTAAYYRALEKVKKCLEERNGN